MRKGNVYVIANWKMNPDTWVAAKELFLGVKKAASRVRKVNTVICPPFVYLSELINSYSGRSISFGVQDVHFEQKGSYTGEVSASQVRSVGATYAIVGHSERRALGETNEMINKKVLSALSEKLTVILCIGERDRDRQGEYLAFLRDELLGALEGVSKAALKNILITYEPIWAIGKTSEEAMKPHDVHGTVLFLRKLLAEKYDKKIALELPILYGGSVEPENAGALLEEGDVNGFLIGHSGLSVSDFTAILERADSSLG